MMTRARIVISVETLLSGGAESFTLRLANSLCSRFEVYLVVVRGDLVDTTVAAKLKVGVHPVKVTFPFEWLIGKFDSGLLRLGIDISLRHILVRKFLRRFLLQNQIDVIHTNQFKVDHVFCDANSELQIPHVITVHGDYLNFSESEKNGSLRLLHFHEKARHVLNTVDKVVYISDHQREFMVSGLSLSSIAEKFVKIYNGVEMEATGTGSVTGEFKRRDFVFGMVARGIKEKGWEEAIRAFVRIQTPGLQLVLVGTSKYLDELKLKYNQENIYFAGYSENPMDWIRLFDVGLLPSTFASESLPTSVIEYIMMGKPVIASDKGEIKKMLEKDGDRCGIVLALSDNRVVEHELSAAMERLWRDNELYKKMAGATKTFATLFDMKTCSESYASVYHTLMQSRS